MGLWLTPVNIVFVSDTGALDLVESMVNFPRVVSTTTDCFLPLPGSPASATGATLGSSSSSNSLGSSWPSSLRQLEDDGDLEEN